MRADNHHCTETLFAVVDAPAAKGVIGDAPAVIQKERPFFFSLFTHTRHNGPLSLQFLSLVFFEQRPNLGLPFFQLRNILSVEMPGAVDPAANLVDIAGSPAYGCGQLFLLGVIHFDDVAVDCHFSEICAHVLSTELSHLALDKRSCSVTQNSMRIGLVRSAIGYSPPSNYNGQIFTDWGAPEKIFPLIFQRTVSSKNLVPAQEKFPFTLQRTLFAPISG